MSMFQDGRILFTRDRLQLILVNLQVRTLFHHYLPRCYLKNFTEPETPPGQKPAVLVFDFEKPQKGWHRKATKNIAGITDFYALLDEDGDKDHSLEEMWGRIESGWPDLLKKLEDPQYVVTLEDRLSLSTFVATFLARVPSEVEDMKRFTQEIYSKILGMMLRTYDARPDVRKEFEERTGIDLTDLMPDKFDISELTVNVPTAFALGMNLNKLETQIGYLMAMEWLVIRPVQKGVFITSDSPVYWTNLDYKGEPVGGGWASEDLLITCPLSRELAVIVCWDGGKPFKTLTTRKMDVVPMINQYTFLGAEKLLIASSLKFAGADKINQKLLEKSSSK